MRSIGRRRKAVRACEILIALWWGCLQLLFRSKLKYMKLIARIVPRARPHELRY